MSQHDEFRNNAQYRPSIFSCTQIILIHVLWIPIVPIMNLFRSFPIMLLCASGKLTCI